MFTPTEALQAFRRRTIELGAERALPALFVLDSGIRVHARVNASWHPVAER